MKLHKFHTYVAVYGLLSLLFFKIIFKVFYFHLSYTTSKKKRIYTITRSETAIIFQFYLNVIFSIIFLSILLVLNSHIPPLL